MTGSMPMPMERPVSSPRTFASRRNSAPFACRRVMRSGSRWMTRSAASAAAVIDGGRPTEKTKPGAE